MLQNGRYTILSGSEGNRPIGLEKDLTNGRSTLVVLPEGSKAPVWVIENAGGQSIFIIKTPDGDAVGEEDGHVWAGSESTPWLLQEAFHHGNNIYIISSHNERVKGWVASIEEEESTQLLFRPLLVGRSMPPFYFPNERFIIQPAESD
ncbi:hypothetical protein PQX77_005287 [Marasmius sp. AFHP31]|nr:hypothetical protein PQX77_005287 [Marasmius sp. AFHP31]